MSTAVLRRSTNGTKLVPSFNPFRTAVPFWGQSNLILSTLSPNRDCASKGVKKHGVEKKRLRLARIARKWGEETQLNIKARHKIIPVRVVLIGTIGSQTVCVHIRTRAPFVSVGSFFGSMNVLWVIKVEAHHAIDKLVVGWQEQHHQEYYQKKATRVTRY